MSVISIEGNIGSGKSELIKNLKEHSHLFSKNIIFLKEPVDAWEDITDENGKKMLAKFYDDQKTYSFSFQMMAYISRLAMLEEVRNNNPDAIIVTERSLYTDKYIFAKMMYDDGNISEIDYKIYSNMYEHFINDFKLKKVIYINSEPNVCYERIIKRNRKGEDIPITYLCSCDLYHRDMIIKEFKNNIISYVDGNIDTCREEHWNNIFAQLKNIIIN